MPYDDAYSRVTRLQTFDVPCPYCHAMQGHYGFCPLLNKHFPADTTLNSVIQEQQNDLATLESEYAHVSPYLDESVYIPSESDLINMHGMGIRWN